VEDVADAAVAAAASVVDVVVAAAVRRAAVAALVAAVVVAVVVPLAGAVVVSPPLLTASDDSSRRCARWPWRWPWRQARPRRQEGPWCGHCRAPQARWCLHRQGQGAPPCHPQPYPRRERVRREAHQRGHDERGRRGGEGRVPCLEPLPLQACGWYPWRS
jgi:hypothetical protein